MFWRFEQEYGDPFGKSRFTVSQVAWYFAQNLVSMIFLMVKGLDLCNFLRRLYGGFKGIILWMFLLGLNFLTNLRSRQNSCFITLIVLFGAHVVNLVRTSYFLKEELLDRETSERYPEVVQIFFLHSWKVSILTVVDVVTNNLDRDACLTDRFQFWGQQ